MAAIAATLGIDIELFHMDEHPDLDLIAFPSGEENPVRGEQKGQIGRKRLLKGLIQPLAP